MTDLEATALCARAMGMRPFKEYPLGNYPEQDGTYEIRGDVVYHLHGNARGGYNRYDYDPFTDDAQMAELVKKFRLELTCGLNDIWICSNRGTTDYEHGDSRDLNRAVVMCAARMQAAKEAKEAK